MEILTYIGIAVVVIVVLGAVLVRFGLAEFSCGFHSADEDDEL